MTDILNNPGGATPDRGYAGQADMNPAVTVSRINESPDVAGDGIDFGVAVAYGATSGNEHCKKWTSDSDKFLGFSGRYVTSPYNPTTSNVSFRQHQTVPIYRMGRLLVTATENTVAGDQVIIKTAASGALGSVTGGVAGAGRVAVTGAKWVETVAAGTLAWMEFNLLGNY